MCNRRGVKCLINALTGHMQFYFKCLGSDVAAESLPWWKMPHGTALRRRSVWSDAFEGTGAG